MQTHGHQSSPARHDGVALRSSLRCRILQIRPASRRLFPTFSSFFPCPRSWPSTGAPSSSLPEQAGRVLVSRPQCSGDHPSHRHIDKRLVSALLLPDRPWPSPEISTLARDGRALKPSMRPGGTAVFVPPSPALPRPTAREPVAPAHDSALTSAIPFRCRPNPWRKHPRFACCQLFPSSRGRCIPRPNADVRERSGKRSSSAGAAKRRLRMVLATRAGSWKGAWRHVNIKSLSMRAASSFFLAAVPPPSSRPRRSFLLLRKRTGR
jgi:hypothetical protein